jgi:GT2 family glycosyltransferase/glycosyltransferase involved in cell wall biosynthesis
LKDSLTSNIAICIAGAHRSGTSMLTRLLHACGLYLGPENELMPAQADNPDGFWEHLGFVALNDELLNDLGGAWDLPPKADESFASPRLNYLRLKAQLLIERLDSASVWGWKDPRNSLTLPFWRGLLPRLKTIVIVRNPLEVAHSMRERNGTSYSFGLRLWEIYNRRLFQAANEQDRLVTHYDLFFEDAEKELRRVAKFAGLPETQLKRAGALVTTGRRHTHFTIAQLIDARVSETVIELYRTLISEASGGRSEIARPAPAPPATKPDEAELLPGSISRVTAFVPERIVQLEHLYGELLTQTEARHKKEVEQLSAHYTSEIDQLRERLAQTEARHEELTADYKKEVEHLHDRLTQMNGLLQERNVSLAGSKAQVEELTDRYNTELHAHLGQTNDLLKTTRIEIVGLEQRAADLVQRLRKQLWATKRLVRLLDDTENAATRLRNSRRWKLFNLIGNFRAKLSHEKISGGYGHLEKVVTEYSKWRAAHPEIAKIKDELEELSLPAATARPEPLKRELPSPPPVPATPIESIHFQHHDQVRVSIVIPVFNKFQYTHACLASLQTVKEPALFEVVIVDDASSDQTAERLSQVPGIRYLRNETNSGFTVSCNRGAEAACGEYIVFLNNDTMVTDLWLTALLDTFAEEPKAGAVGAKLVYPDGRLQEAGCITWRDGSAWNYGKFDDPRKPEYNYLREVDYCSAAALMIPRSLFESVGGFDAAYTPAYYEDTDLCFKVRDRGFRVMYQPCSEVIHHEGITGGKDNSAGAKKHQEINHATFVARWAQELANRPANGDLASFLRGPTPGTKNILVVDHHMPMPDRDSGSLRMFQILKLLHQIDHRVTFIADNLANIPPYTRELQKRGIQVQHYPYIKSLRRYVIKHGSEFDLIILSRCEFARKHIEDIRLFAPQARVIFDTVDLHFLREAREAEVKGDAGLQRRAEERRQLEYKVIDQADETWVVSLAEQNLVQKERPNASIAVVSNIVDVPGCNTPFGGRQGFLFIGGFGHSPNVDAVLYFVESIYPLIAKQLPKAKFFIIGDKAPPKLIALASETIVITGPQADVRPFFDSVKLSVAPLRYGAGVKGKINQSLAFGVPVVATNVAIEGMELVAGTDVLVADDPEQFARAIVDLDQSEELWNRISRNGLNKARTLYSTEAARKQLKRLLSNKHMNSSSGAHIKMERRPSERFHKSSQAVIEASVKETWPG